MQPAVVQVTEVVRPSDARAVRDARNGDVRAFETIVTGELPGAFRLASAILGNEADAADATQNALVAAWRELPRLRDVRSLRRLVLPDPRQRVPDAGSGATAGPGRCPSTPIESMRVSDARRATALDRVEAIDVLEEAFEQLDPEDRAMVVLHHLEGRPLAEIAESLHMPVGTVKWRLHEARQTLQRALEVV